jgi:hypothetical protein
MRISALRNILRRSVPKARILCCSQFATRAVYVHVTLTNLWKRPLLTGLEAGLRTTAIILSIVLLLCPTVTAKPEAGTVCIAPNSAEPPTRISPGGSYNPATLLLKIDKREAIHWPHKESLKIQGLDLKERHLVVLISDGKRIQSFWFRFGDFKDVDLCISFDGYQGVQLQEAKSSPWCKCK